MRKLLYCLTVISALCLPTFGFAEQYLCIADKVTGLMFRDGEWKSTNFVTEDKKWIVKSHGEVTINEKGLVNEMNGAVYKFGEDDIADFDCKVIMNSIYQCTQGSAGQFNFSTFKNKYIRTFTGDFDVFVEATIPFIEIGSCSEF